MTLQLTLHNPTAVLTSRLRSTDWEKQVWLISNLAISFFTFQPYSQACRILNSLRVCMCLSDGLTGSPILSPAMPRAPMATKWWLLDPIPARLLLDCWRSQGKGTFSSLPWEDHCQQQWVSLSGHSWVDLCRVVQLQNGLGGIGRSWCHPHPPTSPFHTSPTQFLPQFPTPAIPSDLFGARH